MATRARRERCSRCGVQLALPAGALSVQCSMCGAVTRVRTHEPVSQVQDSLQQAASLFRGFIGSVSSNINALANSNSGNTNYARPQPSYGYYSAPQPSLAMPPVHGRRRAVLCGVSYRGKRYMLKGSVNDVRCMRYFLVEKMGFPGDSVLVLTEEEPDPLRMPTKHNILMALRWLVHGCQAGDSLVFHYSGHGSKQIDIDMDEIDGYDESICPVDHEISGKILDDEINSTIVRPLPRKATLHAIIDACYSGTMLDLPFFCRMNREGHYRWEDHRLPLATYKGTNGGRAISIGACDDHQTSADTSAFSRGEMTGALTYSFIQAMQNEPPATLTYGRLLNAMRSTIREARTGLRLNGPIASLVNQVLGAGLSQEPQLSSSEMFDVYLTRISL